MVTKTNCELIFNNIMKFKAAFYAAFFILIKKYSIF
jgi:hypothetical protein